MIYFSRFSSEIQCSLGFIITEPASSSLTKIFVPKILNNSSLSNSARSFKVFILFSTSFKRLDLLRSSKLYKSSLILRFQSEFSIRSFSIVTKFLALWLNSEAISSSNPSIETNSSIEASAISETETNPSLTIK